MRLGKRVLDLGLAPGLTVRRPNAHSAWLVASQMGAVMTAGKGALDLRLSWRVAGMMPVARPAWSAGGFAGWVLP